MARSRGNAAERETLAKCLRDFETDENSHSLFVDKARKRYDAYRGVLELSSEAAAWSNQQHPPYILQIIETMVANLLDPRPRWRLKPRPRFDSVDQIQMYQRGAQANELLLAEQTENDHFAEKQRPFGLQGLVTGLTVGKVFWNYAEGTVRRQEASEEPIDEYGIYTVPRLRPVGRPEVIHDDPTFEVVDVEDFIWHEAATSLGKALRVTHRCWYSFDELKDLEQRGVYKNVDELKETRNQSNVLGDRPDDLYEADRRKDMIEVLECWVDRGRRVVSIGNRKVLLRDADNPFWFERLEHPYPFVVCSTMPDMFRIPGISVVETVQSIQEVLWSLLNQQLDVTQLMANAVWLIRDDVDDNGWEWAPGERWVVSGDVTTAAKPVEINPVVGQLSEPIQMRLKDDLQNIPGASPTLLGQVDPSTQTATEVSLTTSLAQRRVAAQKMQFSWAYQRVGEQWICLNQQFVDRQRVVAVTGPDGAQSFFEVRPEYLQGHFLIEVEQMDESLNRQERRAEASALYQLFLNGAGHHAAMAQAGIGRPLNPEAFLNRVLDQYGIDDKERYYSAAPPPPAQPATGPAQGAQPNGQPSLASAGGVTAPQAFDMSSPSNQTSMSPEVFMQRFGAMSGGANNV